LAQVIRIQCTRPLAVAHISVVSPANIMGEEDETLEYAEAKLKERICVAGSGCMFTVMIIIISVSAPSWNMHFKGGASETCSHPHYRAQDADLFNSVCEHGSTESSFSSPLDSFQKGTTNNKSGVYRCACCGEVLFPASTKFDSGTGWPSYWAPVEGDQIGYTIDLGQMASTEVHCNKCGAHLGHVFAGVSGGGAGKTNYRYCINGVCLRYDALTELPFTSDVPWVLDSYAFLFVMIAGIGSGCSLCFKAPRAYKTCSDARQQIKPTEVSEETVVVPQAIGSDADP